MRRILNEINNHRPSAAAVLLYGLIALGLDVFGWHKPENRPDMVPAVIYRHLLLPVIAGALIAWWRRNIPGGIPGGMLAGAAVLVIDAAALLSHQFIAYNLGEPGSSGERATELPVFLIAIGLVGSLLGLVGAAGIAAFCRLLDRSAPSAGQTATNYRASAHKPGQAAAGIPRHLLRVAGGFVVSAAVVVLFVVIPSLMADNISVSAPRALPAFAVHAILNLLVAIALFTPVSRWGAAAAKTLVVMAAFVSLLLGFSLVDAASALTAHAGRLFVAAGCWTGAAADLVAGALALIAVFRRGTICGEPLPASSR